MDVLSRVLGSHIPDERINGKPLHEPLELFKGKLAHLLGVTGPCEVAGSYPLVKEQEAVTLPQQTLDASG